MQAWDEDPLGGWGDRVASADICVEVRAGGRELRGHRYPDPWVDVLVANFP